MRIAVIIVAAAAFSLVASPAWAQQPTTSPEAYSGPAWSPYLVGALIGVLSMFTFYFSNKPLGRFHRVRTDRRNDRLGRRAEAHEVA